MAPVEQAVTYVEGVRTFYRRVGGDGPPVVFIHGHPTHSEDWLPFLERLGAPALAPDLPGWGHTERPADFDYSMHGLARFVGRFLDRLGVVEHSLVVHDWGVVGLIDAQRRPARVRRLVVMNAVPLLPGYRWHWIARYAWRVPLVGEFSNLTATKPVMRSAYVHGVINSSLSQSAARAGLSHSMTMDMASVFGYDIDFAQDIRQGDEFDVIYEQKVANGKVVGTGNILSARFTNRGKTYTAVRYTNKQGNSSYYTADGNSMRKAFIRTPVDFARISSRFSMGRKHPILNKIRAHKGVDYAAPRGTPIKAAGDGKVLLAGRRGGYGNTVIIQHGNTYRTLYGHMQGFAKGVQTGGTVKQGQVIGYIGTTGLSTGPHLHYEFQVNGVHVDPLGQKLPMADPIAKAERARFMQQSQPLMARMDQERSTLLASAKR